MTTIHKRSEFATLFGKNDEAAQTDETQSASHMGFLKGVVSLLRHGPVPVSQATIPAPRRLLVPFTLTPTASAYTAGLNIGGLKAIATGFNNTVLSLQRASLLIQAATQSATTPTWIIDFFSANPSGSTFTDAALEALATADAAKWAGNVNITGNTSGLTGAAPVSARGSTTTSNALTTDANGFLYLAIVAGNANTLGSSPAGFGMLDFVY